MATPNREQIRGQIQLLRGLVKGASEAPGAFVGAYESQGRSVLGPLSTIARGMVDPQAGYDAARRPEPGNVLQPQLDRALDPGFQAPTTGPGALLRAGAKSVGSSAAYAPMALAGGGLLNLPQLFGGNAAGAVAGEAARQAGWPGWAQMGANIGADLLVGGAIDRGIKPGTPFPPDIEQQPKPIRDAFDRWSGPDTVYYDPESADVPPMGDPLIVKGYHGTTHDIRRIDPTKFNGESDMGPGFYATSGLEDAEVNYASAGTSADIQNKIEMRAEQVFDDIVNYENLDEYGVDESSLRKMSEDGTFNADAWRAYARKVAESQVVGEKEGNVLPTFLRLNKPAYVGIQPPKAGRIYFGLDIDAEGNQIDSENLNKLSTYLHDAEYEYQDFDAQAAINRVLDQGDDLTPDEIIKAITTDNYAMDDSGRLAAGKIAQGALKSLGYDSAIRFDPATRWRMHGTQMGDQHYTVFDPGPENVKATTARGFDPSNPDLEDPAFVPRGEDGAASTIEAETNFKARVEQLRAGERAAEKRAQLRTRVQLARAAEKQAWEEKVQANRVFPDQPDELANPSMDVPQSNVVRRWLNRNKGGGPSPEYRDQAVEAEKILAQEDRIAWHRQLRDQNLTEGRAWYNTDAVRADLGDDEMRKMAAFGARNSAGSPVPMELRRDLWAMSADRAGLNIGELDPYSPDLKKTFGAIGMTNQNGPWKRGLQDIQDEFRRRAAAGEDMAAPFFDPNKQPKFARYAEDLSGNMGHAPGDYMMARLMYGPVGRDPRTLASDEAWTKVKRPSGGIGDNLSDAEADALEKHVRRLSDEAGIATGQGQAAIWVGGQKLSPNGTDGRTWQGHLNVALQELGDRLGISPAEAWARVKAGKFTRKELGALAAILGPFIGWDIKMSRQKEEKK